MTIAADRNKMLLMAGLIAVSLLQPAASGAVPILSRLSITVYATYGLGPIHTTPSGAGTQMDAIVSLDYGEVEERVDVYIGAILPDGHFRSWIGDPLKPSLATGTTPVPLLVNVVPEAATYNVSQLLSGADPRGWYILYGIIVPAGAAPIDPSRWLSTYFYPLLVTPPLF